MSVKCPESETSPRAASNVAGWPTPRRLDKKKQTTSVAAEGRLSFCPVLPLRRPWEIGALRVASPRTRDNLRSSVQFTVNLICQFWMFFLKLNSNSKSLEVIRINVVLY